MESRKNNRRRYAKTIKFNRAHFLQAHKSIWGDEIMQKEFLTVREVAEELHTTERTIREIIKNGSLKAKKVGTKYIVTIQATRLFTKLKFSTDEGIIC